MKITQEEREFAAAKGMAEEQVLAAAMQAKAGGDLCILIVNA